MQYEYIERIYEILKLNKVILEDKMSTTDENVTNFEEGKTSFTSFMRHVITNGWIDLSLLDIEDNSFLSSGEIYNKVLDYAIKVAFEDEGMNKIVYKDMIDIAIPFDLLGSQFYKVHKTFYLSFYGAGGEIRTHVRWLNLMGSKPIALGH